MEGKKKNGQIIAVIILAVCILLGVGACVFLKLQQGSEKLAQGNMQEKAADAATETEEVQQEEAMSESLESFDVASAEGGETAGKDQPEAAEEETSEYLCSYSSERLMTEADVEELKAGIYEDLPEGKNIIQMVINELYARYGYQFSNEEIQKYFDQKQWYQDIAVRNSDMDSIFKGMTEIEKANVEFLSPFGE